MDKEKILNFACAIPGINASSLDSGHLAKFDYLGVFDFGHDTYGMSVSEKISLRLKLSKYREGRCFFVSKNALDHETEIDWLNQLYASYLPIPDYLQSYIGLVSIRDGETSPKPIFEEMGRINSSDPNDTLNEQAMKCLKKIKIKLGKLNMKKFTWPSLAPTLQNMVFSNGRNIQRLKQKMDMSFDAMMFADNPETKGTSKISKRSIIKARDGDLVKPHILEHLSYRLDVDPSELTLTNIVPDLIGLAIARKIIATHGAKDVRDWFGSLSDTFFESLEEGIPLSVADMRFIYHHYKKATKSLGLTAALEHIIDLDATESLHGM